MNNNNKKTEIHCDIVRDLLPLYHDGVVSEASKTVIEDHLAECEPCKKEYEELLLDLPIQSSNNNTKSKFKALISRQKTKRICILITSIILTCVLVLSTVFVLTEVPLAQIPDDEVKIHRVYGYESEDRYEFFVLFNTNWYEAMSFELGEYKDGIQSLDFKKPIISNKVDSSNSDDIWRITLYNEYAEELNSLSFRGKVIWNKDDADTKIPEYVYEYISNEYKSDVWATTDLDVDKDYIRISYDDGSYKQWTIDGELVEQSD